MHTAYFYRTPALLTACSPYLLLWQSCRPSVSISSRKVRTTSNYRHECTPLSHTVLTVTMDNMCKMKPCGVHLPCVEVSRLLIRHSSTEGSSKPGKARPWPRSLQWSVICWLFVCIQAQTPATAGPRGRLDPKQNKMLKNGELEKHGLFAYVCLDTYFASAKSSQPWAAQCHHWRCLIFKLAMQHTKYFIKLSIHKTPSPKLLPLHQNIARKNNKNVSIDTEWCRVGSPFHCTNLTAKGNSYPRPCSMHRHWHLVSFSSPSEGQSQSGMQHAWFMIFMQVSSAKQNTVDKMRKMKFCRVCSRQVGAKAGSIKRPSKLDHLHMSSEKQIVYLGIQDSNHQNRDLKYQRLTTIWSWIVEIGIASLCILYLYCVYLCILYRIVVHCEADAQDPELCESNVCDSFVVNVRLHDGQQIKGIFLSLAVK